MARNYNQAVGNLPISTMLPLDTILVGSSRTRSSSSLVTDSAGFLISASLLLILSFSWRYCFRMQR